MKLYAIIDLPAETRLAQHCPDLATLRARVAANITEAIFSNTFAPELPTVRLHVERQPICSRCAAPLLPSGACSSRNCPVGRQPMKLRAAQIAAMVEGVTTGNKLRKRNGS